MKSAHETYVDIEPVSEEIHQRKKNFIRVVVMWNAFQFDVELILNRSGFALLLSLIGFKTRAS